MNGPHADNPASDSLESALAQHGIELPEDQIQRLDAYRRLLWEWNEKINLTRHTSFEKFVGRDVVDALVFSQFLAPGEDVLDVGSGGGAPGIILAILRPDISVSLCESMAKKARVLESMRQTLGLDSPVENARAEDLLSGGATYDTLLLRAVAKMEKFLRWFNPHWGHFRRILAIKGPAWTEERAACRHLGLMKNLDLRRLHTYTIAESDAESVLLELRQKAESPSGR